MARTNRFTHSVVLGMTGQVITMLAGLWLTPFLLRRLGAASYGLWIVGQQLLVYLTLLDIGVIALLPREIAYLTGRGDDPLDLSALIGRTLRMILLQTPLVALAGMALWLAIPHSWLAIRTPVGLAAIAFTLLFPTRIFRAILEGLQDLSFISYSFMTGWLFGLITAVSLVISGAGLRALAIGWATSQVVDAALCFVRVRRKFPQAFSMCWRSGGSGDTKAQFRRGLWVSVSQLAQVLIYGTDAAILGRLFGPAAVVPYSATGKLIAVLSNQPQTIMRAAEPGLSQMRVSESRARLESVTGALSLAMLLASGLVAVLALTVNAGFVRWWVGGSYYGGLWLTVLFAVSMGLRHLNVTTIYTLFAFGQERMLAITSLIDGILSTILSIALAWWFHSSAGVLAGSILSTTCVLVWGNGRRLARELGIPLTHLARPLFGWFWRMLLAATAAAMLGARLGHSSPVLIALGGVAAVCCYAALMFPVAMKSTLEPYLTPRLATLLKLRVRFSIALRGSS